MTPGHCPDKYSDEAATSLRAARPQSPSLLQSPNETDRAIRELPPQSTNKPLPFLTPGRALLFSSLPLGLGAYIGYRRAISSSSSESSSRLFTGRGNSILEQRIYPQILPTSTPTSNGASLKPKINTPPPPLLAARALALGSLLSISATSLLVSCVFFASGCHSTEELIATWRPWAPKKLKDMENALGVTSHNSERIEYEKAVKGMTEEEEWDYVKQRYGAEIKWEGADGN